MMWDENLEVKPESLSRTILKGRPWTLKRVHWSFSKTFSEVASCLRGTRWVYEVKRSIMTMIVVYPLD